MQMTTCAECGARIDLDQGVCPICGTTYYNLIYTPKQEVSGETKAWGQPLIPPGFDAPTRRYDTPLIPPELLPEADVRIYTGRDAATPTPEAPEPPAAPGPETATAAHAAARARTSAGRRATLWGQIATLTAVLAVVGGLMLVLSGRLQLRRSELQAMPGVVGQTEASAVSVLEEMQLHVITAGSYSDTVLEGVVLAQEPGKGEAVAQGDRVTLTVSMGMPPAETETAAAPAAALPLSLPLLVGGSFNDAKLLLESAGVTLEPVEWVYSDAPRGEILTQETPEGAVLRAGDTVNVTVSLGSEPEQGITYTVSATAGKGGEISPKGQIAVGEGGALIFTFEPEAGYVVDSLEVDGRSIGARDSYSFEDVAQDHSLYVTFRKTDAVQLPTASAPVETPEPEPSPEASPADSPEPEPTDEPEPEATEPPASE